MISLKDVLLEKEIKNGIQGDLGNLIHVNMDYYIEETIRQNSNSTSIIIDENGEYDFECNLHYDDKKDIYLLEARLFRKTDNSMVNSYLGVLNSNLGIIDEEIDDVWEYGEWQEVC
ncbi:hypothetical protein [Clostridium sp.]|uniref:hypothetical protein n=1 Tax=Clostridium sp. TaxID=1506 RepID=UPI001B61A169|nr:hypothetical protein [Clostridium sp.]MBP3917349.1 hypothetical protein [Clostridium sp.]